ncbi:phosphotransferase [Microlunatus spumicola]|uniref:phosphotransferase n=1 Tax=Microlunatus spumicola TaxID=81499 RepID=UPI001958F2F2
MTRDPGDERPAEVLDDVARAVGAEATLGGRLAGGINDGALRVRLAGRGDAVLKAVARDRPDQLDETLRAQRIVERMRSRGYPTPAWLGVGATSTHVWHLMDLVDAAPVRELTPAVVEQLMEIVELQSGRASEPYDHSAYAWKVATGREPSVAGLSSHPTAVSTLVQRLPLVPAGAPSPLPRASDMVHADLNPSNVLVRGGAVVAVVDIENAGSGTRATDLTTLQWHTFQDSLAGVRQRLWTRILELVGWEGAAVLATTQILLQLEWPIRLGRRKELDDALERSHRTVDELEELR